jgi:peptide/nickel transport system substrate-binding protein
MADQIDRTSAAISRREALRFGGLAGLSALPIFSPSAGFAASSPRRGGDMRVGSLGGSSSDTIDAHKMINEVDYLRAKQLYEPLTQNDRDAHVVNVLAESLEPNNTATLWTIRLRKGITFHNGKLLTAKDVLFSLMRIADPKNPLDNASSLAQLDFKNAKVLDDLTLQMPMLTPFSVLPEILSGLYIVPTDYDPAHPIGTGPFKFQSFTPGQQSVFVRNENYWVSGRPYLNSLTVIDSFQDETAAFNALQSGQVHVFPDVPLVLLNQVSGGSGIKVLLSEPSKWTPFTMRVDQPPFNDVRVRQAFRLIVDRKQLGRIAFNGHAAVGNDLFSNWSTYYDGSLRREQDIDQAKFLLKQAGQQDLSVELMTSDVAAGVVQSAQVFSRQAKRAGITVKVHQVTSDIYYGPNYLKWTFAQDYWYCNPFFAQVYSGSLPGSSFNETHWADPTYIRLFNQALQTVDDGKRHEIAIDMQKVDFDHGGYIIGTYNQTADLMASNVEGFLPSKTGEALGQFGFDGAWFS